MRTHAKCGRVKHFSISSDYRHRTSWRHPKRRETDISSRRYDDRSSSSTSRLSSSHSTRRPASSTPTLASTTPAGPVVAHFLLLDLPFPSPLCLYCLSMFSTWHSRICMVKDNPSDKLFHSAAFRADVVQSSLPMPVKLGHTSTKCCCQSSNSRGGSRHHIYNMRHCASLRDTHTHGFPEVGNGRTNLHLILNETLVKPALALVSDLRKQWTLHAQVQ